MKREGVLPVLAGIGHGTVSARDPAMAMQKAGVPRARETRKHSLTLAGQQTSGRDR